MTVQSMLGVFILLGISIVAGFVIMIIERIYASAKEKHRQVIIMIIKFSASDNAFRVLLLVQPILVISSYILV